MPKSTPKRSLPKTNHDKKKSTITHTSFFSPKSKTASTSSRATSTPKVSTQSKAESSANGKGLVPCPLCMRNVPASAINLHLDACTGPQLDTGKSTDAPRRPPGAPDGLMVYENFLTEEEEMKLIQTIETLQFKAARRNGKHLSVGFGRVTDWGVRRIRPTPPGKDLPEWITVLVDRIKLRHGDQLGMWVPNETNVNKYVKSLGHHINPHMDDRHLSGEFIANVSLGSNCYMTFGKGLKTVKVALPRRSMSVMSRESRYNWTHGICNDDLGEDVRYSINLRQV